MRQLLFLPFEDVGKPGLERCDDSGRGVVAAAAATVNSVRILGHVLQGSGTIPCLRFTLRLAA